MKRFILLLLALSLLTAGVLSWFASSHPDGLERVAEDKGFIEKVKNPSYEILPDYTVPGVFNKFQSNGLAGIIGTVTTFFIVNILGKFLARRKKHRGSDVPLSY